MNASDCLAPEAPNNTGLAEMPLPRTCNATTPECLDDEDCGGAGRGACLNSTCACVSPFKGTDPNENTHVMSMLITCHDTCHTHTLHMSICVQAGVVPFAPTQAQDRPATHRATAAGTGGVVSGRQRASADRGGWEIIAQSAHVHLAFKVQTRVHVSHVLRELTRQRQDLLAHRVWPANTEASLAEFPRPRAVTARTTQILGMVAIMSLNAFATRDILVLTEGPVVLAWRELTNNSMDHLHAPCVVGGNSRISQVNQLPLKPHKSYWERESSRECV